MNQQEPEINIPVGNKPWLAPDGKMLTDDQLRIVSKKWTPAVWETFLVETVEKRLKEVSKSAWAYQNAVEEMECTFWNEGGFDQGDEKREVLIRRKMRDHLTVQQRQILRLYFWDSLSERAVAEKMGISHAQVHTSKKNSLKKLEGLLKDHIRTPRIGERSGVIFPPPEHPDMDLDIYETYLEDLKGPMWCRGG